MYQHVGVRIVSENNRLIKEIDVNFAPILNKLISLESFEMRYPWISTIDPYGDTTVNALQREHFKTDLDNLKHEINDANIAEMIEKIIASIDSLGVHQYLKFIGD